MKDGLSTTWSFNIKKVNIFETALDIGQMS